VGIFLIGVIASLFSAIDVGNSIKEIIQFLQLSILFTVLLYNNIKQEKTINAILSGIVFGASVLALSATYLFFKHGPEGVYALGFHKNALGSFMAVSLPLAIAQFRQRPKLWRLVLIICVAAGLIASYSRGAWVGAFSGLVMVESLYQKRNLIWVIIFGAVILLLYPLIPTKLTRIVADPHTLELREEQWSIAESGFNRHILTGVGYANFLLLSQERNILHQHEDPHNILLRLAAETGLTGLTAFIILFAGIYGYCYQAVKQEQDLRLQFWERGIFASLVAYLVHGMFDVFWVRGTGSLFWILVGIIVVLYERRRELTPWPK
jgi:O-antigen ligase